MVDDEKDILKLSEMALNRHKENLNIQTTTDPTKVIESVEKDDTDAILSDYNMPEMNGVELLEEVRNIDEDLPFILYTGQGSEEIAEEAISSNITDYFQKKAGLEHYKFILNSIQNNVKKYRNKERAEILSVLVNNSNQPVIVTDTDVNIIYANEALENVSGYSKEELIGKNPNLLSSETHSEEDFEEMYRALNNGEKFNFDGMKNQTKTGEIYIHDQELIPIALHNRTPDYFVGISEVKTE